MESPPSRVPAAPSAFGRSLAASLCVHGAALGAGLFVIVEARPGTPHGLVSAAVMVVAAEPESEWRLEVAPESAASELETPELPAAELVPVEAPAEAFESRPTPDEALLAAPLVDWGATRVDGRPLARLEGRPKETSGPSARTATRAAPAAAAVEPAAPPAPRGEERPLRLVEGPPPVYPRVALRMQQQGTVLLEIEVDAAGRVAAARVVESSGFEHLDEAAREGVLAWRFEPALRDGAPVPERFRHRIQFVLEG